MTDQPAPIPAGREIDDAIDSTFDQGDRTIPIVRGQMFSFDESGTRPRSDVPPAMEVATERAAGDPIARLEQKVDSMIKMVAALKTKVDSIDSVLAKIIHRVP